MTKLTRQEARELFRKPLAEFGIALLTRRLTSEEFDKSIADAADHVLDALGFEDRQKFPMWPKEAEMLGIDGSTLLEVTCKCGDVVVIEQPTCEWCTTGKSPETFHCPSCNQDVPVSQGAADSAPHMCDECWKGEP